MHEPEKWWVLCSKSTGSGSIIGGEPGTGEVKSLNFSECKLAGGGLRETTCKLAKAPKLENVETELVVLKNETLAYELKNINTGKQNSDKVFFEVTGCGVDNAEPNLTGNVASTIPDGHFNLATPLGFPEKEVEGSKLEWGRGAVNFEGSYTMKLANGEALAAKIVP